PGLALLNPVPHREGYHQPLVLHTGEKYLMYFNDHRQGLGYIRVAESEDGFTWEIKHGDCLKPDKPWERRGLHYPWVIQDGNHFVMWYTSENHKLHWFLSRAVSEDGIHWQREPADRPVISFETTRPASK